MLIFVIKYLNDVSIYDLMEMLNVIVIMKRKNLTLIFDFSFRR
jgi:hypothetical protein